MSLQKVGSIKISKFDKDNYNLWKKKIDLFIRATNIKYLEILDKDSFVPMKIVSKSVEDGVVILQGLIPKDPSEFTGTKKETVTLDISLQLIIVESLDD